MEPMQYGTLGRTGLRVSVAGLGCGGYSRLGSRKHGTAHAVRLVRAAFDRGVTLFDTAIQYETQPLVAAGLAGIERERYVLCTKFEAGKYPDAELQTVVEGCLRELRTDYLDVFYLHTILPEQYDEACARCLPQLTRLREQGKIRFTGITEDFYRDPRHAMLHRAAQDGRFDVLMTGYNILNPSARELVFPAAEAANLGVVAMYAVRRPFYDPETLRAMLREQWERGNLPERVQSLDFLLEAASSLPEAGCRFTRHHSAVSAVLTGPGSVEHLEQNLRATLAPPLPEPVLRCIDALFSRSDAVSLL